MVDALSFARIWRSGSPPVAGGALDQTCCFLEAAEMIWDEIDETRSELGHYDLRNLIGW